MKRSLAVAAILICVFLIGSFAQAIYQHKSASEQSNELALKVTTEVLRSWDPQPILAHADTSYLETHPPEMLANQFDALSRMGELTEISNINYDISMPAWWQRSQAATAEYVMTAVFSSGYAEVTIRMVRKNSRWLITHYQVASPLLAA